MIAPSAVVLAFVPSGALVEIVGFAQNAGKGFIRKITSLGLTPGSIVQVLQNQFPGPIILLVRGTRIFLGRGASSKILVRVVG